MNRRIHLPACLALTLLVASPALAERELEGPLLTAPLGSAPSLDGVDAAPETLPFPTPNSVLKAPVLGAPVIGREQVVATPLPVICCDNRDVDYKYHRLGSKCKFSKCDTHEVLMLYKDNCDCCFVQVPVCVPDCCSEICSITCRKGIFGREVTEYRWDCGFRMEIVADRRGDLTVHYFGMVR